MLRRTILALASACLVGAVLAVPATSESRFIIAQSTTSTQNSGLFDYLLPMFKEKTGIEVRVVAVGTGQAIKNATNGDGDILMVHAKASEEKFVAEGHGVKRFDLMYNDFVLVGPDADPAGIGGTKDIVAAFKKIAGTKAPFASRGDDSGTHKKEQALWKAAGVDATRESGGWYRETGSGMGAYVLTDRATWISFKNKAGLEIQVEGDDNLFNQYGVILVNPEKHSNVKTEMGQQFIDWLLSTEGQQAVASFKIDGQQLFFPNAQPDT